MSWEDIVKEGKKHNEMMAEIKQSLHELLFDGERKERITVPREFLHLIWGMLDDY